MDIQPTNQSGKPTSSGVVLVAFGKPQYYWAAYNLAYSIKRFNMDLQIALISDSKDRALLNVSDLHEVIDVYVEIPQENIYTNKKLDPGKAKVLLYDYLPYKYNLYLDVDAVCLKELKPLIQQLIDSDVEYGTSIHGIHTIDKGRDFKEMVWAYADDFVNHFKIEDGALIYGINSSIQFIKKGKVCKKLFKVASDQFIKNPLPIYKLRSKWGGGQPDELYFNAALSITGTEPHKIDAVCFQTQRELTFVQIEEGFHLMSYYGGKRFTPMFYIEWLDRKMKAWMKEDGKVHKYFIHRITDHKYVDGK